MKNPVYLLITINSGLTNMKQSFTCRWHGPKMPSHNMGAFLEGYAMGKGIPLKRQYLTYKWVYEGDSEHLFIQRCMKKEV